MTLADFPAANAALQSNRFFECDFPRMKKAWAAFEVRGIFLHVNGKEFKAPEILKKRRAFPELVRVNK